MMFNVVYLGLLSKQGFRDPLGCGKLGRSRAANSVRVRAPNLAPDSFALQHPRNIGLSAGVAVPFPYPVLDHILYIYILIYVVSLFGGKWFLEHAVSSLLFS